MARRAFANFDQPDLKAVHGFTVSAPETWTVLSNSRHTSIDALADGGRLWTFEDTPRLSTYVTVVNAGPFYELRDQRGGYDLGLFCRQSLKAQLDRDAPELFLLTEQGLAWFGEKFGAPFAQDKYDQVFVPDMGGAMENWGCVTWGDGVLLRGTPTYDQRRRIALILLHEMAHMWFGDLVTMKWWDDLWLNEAFASWAATWAAVGATTYTDCWAGYLAADKQEGYRVDLGPASHPIRGDVPDVSQAMANFDAISYHKGQAVLRQLSAYAGDDAFVEGLRTYFRDHAWGNTRLEDLTGAIGAACGEDLTGWQKDWLDRAGTDTLTLTGAPGQWRLRAEGPHGESARSHRLDIGCYALDGDSLRHVGDVAVRTSGGETEVDLPSCDLRLVNDHDLTFAAVRPDPASLELMLTHAGRLPDAVSRSLAVATAYDMLVKGELSADETLTCVLGVLETEQVAGVVEPFLRLAGLVAGKYTPIDKILERRHRVADRAAALAANPDLRTGALQSLAANAVTAEHFALLDEAAEDDFALAWRVQATRAARGSYDPEAVEQLLERDPDPDAAVNALIVRASRNLPEAKEEAWHALYVDQSVPGGPSMGQMIQAPSGGPSSATCCCPSPTATSRRSPLSPAAACSRSSGWCSACSPRSAPPTSSSRPRRWPAPRAPTRRSAPPCSVASTPWSASCGPAASSTDGPEALSADSVLVRPGRLASPGRDRHEGDVHHVVGGQPRAELVELLVGAESDVDHRRPQLHHRLAQQAPVRDSRPPWRAHGRWRGHA